VWLEELIAVAEASSSSPLYPLLKRSDERYVAMTAYEHPVFVEDRVRAAAIRLREDERIAQFSVEAINGESIHDHGAFARLTWPHMPEAQALGCAL
jgi:GTP cyclohydrolase I